MAFYSDEKSKQERIAQATETTKQVKTLKQLMNDISGLKLDGRTRKSVENKLKKSGYTGEVNEKVVIAYKAVERAESNSKDFEVYRDTIGEKPKDSISVELDGRLDTAEILSKHFSED